MPNKDLMNKLSDFPMNSENPFLEQAVEEIDRHVVRKWKNTAGTDKKAILTAVNADTGEVMGHTTFVRQIEVDDNQFAKLYLTQFQSFFDLTPAGIRVFGYIMQCMKPKKDLIVFVLEDCIEYTKYSKPTIYKGLAQLIKAGIIARGQRDYLYFINPLIVWNGDRVRFVNEYVKKRKNTKQVEDKSLSLPFENVPAKE